MKNNLLKEMLENDEQFERFRNDLRAKFSNDLGPRTFELITATEREFPLPLEVVVL